MRCMALMMAVLAVGTAANDLYACQLECGHTVAKHYFGRNEGTKSCNLCYCAGKDDLRCTNWPCPWSSECANAKSACGEECMKEVMVGSNPNVVFSRDCEAGNVCGPRVQVNEETFVRTCVKSCIGVTCPEGQTCQTNGCQTTCA
eukprot:TRINITY_DN18858_c0_g1_i4.p2 TRINITY_DN18858_c0_g1~~TRINITY_DN18858_c0_g1_i4.p2  ORF type:complete len:145 (+),score=56.03 TRINITY_DN18858_c0_g1_i4:61-495(+)